MLVEKTKAAITIKLGANSNYDEEVSIFEQSFAYTRLKHGTLVGDVGS